MLIVYNLLLTLTSPIWATWMLLRARRRKESVNWKERTGEYSFRWTKGTRRVWLHAVSVGEVVAALPLLKELRERLPHHEIVLSVTTSSGHETARTRAGGLTDHLVYFPIDVLRFSMAALTRVRPEVVVIMETELWPNFLWAARQLGTRTIVANARISDRAWPKNRRLAFFFRWVLGHVDRVLAQSETDAERFRHLGAKDVVVAGNVKFDEPVGAGAGREEWRSRLGVEGFVTVVGSLRAEEFAFVAPALREIARHGPVVVAPRHLEKTEELAALLGDPPRRSRGETARDGLLLLDTYGELAEVYAAGDVAVVGGGFADLGGQNILQPLAHGVPTVHGPHMKNFRDVAAVSSAATVVCEAAGLAETVARLREDADLRSSKALAARDVLAANRGATSRVAAEVVRLTEAS